MASRRWRRSTGRRPIFRPWSGTQKDRASMPLAASPADPLDRIDTARRKINQLQAKGDEGRRAVRFVKDTFAETVDRMIDTPLMSGDPATLQTFEQNRERLARLRSITRKSPNEDADATVARLTNAGAKVGDMANWL